MFAWENLSVGLVSASQTQTTTLAVTTDAEIGNDLSVNNDVVVGNDVGVGNNVVVTNDLQVAFAGTFGTNLNAAFVGASGLMETPTMVLVPQVNRPTTPVQGQSIYRGAGYIETYDGAYWDSAVQRDEQFIFNRAFNQTFSQNVATEFPPIQMEPAAPGVTNYFTIAPQSGSAYGNTNAIVVPSDFEGVLSIVIRLQLRSGDANAQQNINMVIQATTIQKVNLTNGANFGYGAGATGVNNIDLPAGFADTFVIFPPIRLRYDASNAFSAQRQISFFALQTTTAAGVVSIGAFGPVSTLSTSPA
jgi:hypothetical protein